jgi:hypothetical protein
MDTLISISARLKQYQLSDPSVSGVYVMSTLSSKASIRATSSRIRDAKSCEAVPKDSLTCWPRTERVRRGVGRGGSGGVGHGGSGGDGVLDSRHSGND